MSKVSFIIPGQVVSNARPRASIIHGHASVYKPRKNTIFQNLVRITAEEALKGAPPSEKPIALTACFYLMIPKSKSKKVKEQMLDGDILPTVKPDLDNAIKGIMDGLNTVAWLDDKQVVYLRTSKFYSDKPQTMITIQEVESLEDLCRI